MISLRMGNVGDGLAVRIRRISGYGVQRLRCSKCKVNCECWLDSGRKEKEIADDGWR